MNGYDLSRKWFDFCFENPDKIKPNHSAVYFFAIEHCNRLGWKEKFGFPTLMAMEAIGIKSYNTYINTLNDIVEWGFIEMVERSKNQHSSNIIALSKFDKALDKALDKAMLKHDTKQLESTIQSNSSIDKPLTNKPKTNKPKTEINLFENEIIEFEEFWNLYDKKTGKPKCEAKWKKINHNDKELIMAHLPKYKLSQPEKTYRKNPLTYLNGQCWNDEIIDSNGTSKNNSGNIQRNQPASVSHRSDGTDYSSYGN
ncbi:MAG: hypothetical protein ACJASM_002037 [Salibacteraceae bacterium]|jgi:hypothetical protein